MIDAITKGKNAESLESAFHLVIPIIMSIMEDYYNAVKELDVPPDWQRKLTSDFHQQLLKSFGVGHTPYPLIP